MNRGYEGITKIFNIQYLLYKIFVVDLPNNRKTMSIYNINKVAGLVSDKNHYTYIRVKNMFSGLKGKSTKKDIQEVRKILKREFLQIDSVLSKLENE